MFGKVYQIDTEPHFEALIGSGHECQVECSIHLCQVKVEVVYLYRVSDDDLLMENNDYIVDTGYTPVALKSTYNTETALETYLSDNGIFSVGTMMKRVEGSNPDNRLDINDPDFEGQGEVGNSVWSIDFEAWKKLPEDGTSIPNATGDWIASYDSSNNTATFTKVVEVNGLYVPDSNLDPMVLIHPMGG